MYWQYLWCQRLRHAHELAKEAPLGEQLMFHDFQHCLRAGVRSKRHILGRETAPNGNHFVRCARVDFQQVMADDARGICESGIAVKAYFNGMANLSTSSEINPIA